MDALRRNPLLPFGDLHLFQLEPELFDVDGAVLLLSDALHRDHSRALLPGCARPRSVCRILYLLCRDGCLDAVYALSDAAELLLPGNSL